MQEIWWERSDGRKAERNDSPTYSEDNYDDEGADGTDVSESVAKGHLMSEEHEVHLQVDAAKGKGRTFTGFDCR